MPDSFTWEIMGLGFVAAILVGFVASYFGVFIVQRRMAFLGSGLAHAAFGGVALGILLDTQPLFVALPFTISVAIAIIWVRDHTGLAEDTVIGVMFSVAMALGVVFLFLKEGFSGDAYTYLFGSVLAVSMTDVVLAGCMVAATLCTFPLWGAWAYATFDRDLARTDRLRVVWHDYVLACAMSIVIVVSMKIVGMVLIAAFLVLPAATARMLSQSFRQMTLISIAIGVTTPAIGMYLSLFPDLPPGAPIILVQSAMFVAALVVRKQGMIK
ncbi:MAG: metal ABC transporter permease [Candidatus Hydrogenedentes bacterium]|nr:metal ABC transporter permease [Candidatus Hydrogenedentota bacterium]